ncbi:MAG: hypothetical protein DME46_11125 [Verrucomicrobia bacterium]|nr:MAG: hypothetical protein DME46_11125 [Verrucomicrobiota bacterium]
MQSRSSGWWLNIAKVNPDLVVRDVNGKVNTVRYDAVNAMLLNEFPKEHRKVQLEINAGQQQKHLSLLLQSRRRLSIGTKKLSAARCCSALVWLSGSHI